jgi:Dolichyl-phosphate-mannose-protein mannosyltransferase
MPLRRLLSGWWSGTRGVAVILLFGLALAGLAARALISYNPDDNHFAMAAQLVADGYTPYLDFPFFQMPYTPYIYALGLAAQLTSLKFVSLRLISILFCFASVAAVYVGCKAIAKSHRVAIAVALIYSSSEYLNLAAEQLNSYAIANFFAILSFTALVVARRHFDLSAFLSGVCLGAAIGSKLYYVVLAPPLLAFAAASVNLPNRRVALKLAAMWLLGVAIALIPVCVLALRDPAIFWFDNFGYHMLNAQWRELTNFNRGMSWAGKLDFLTQILSTPVFLATGILGYFFFSRFRENFISHFIDISRVEVRIFFLAAATLSLALAAAMVPKPLWESYFLAPLPFALFVLASLFRLNGESASLKQKYWDVHMLSVAVIVSIMTVPANLHLVRRATDVNEWSTLAFHRHGQKIRNHLAEQGRVGTLISFENLYAIEGRIPMPREMAGGVFAYRVGNLMARDLRSRTRILSPSTINQFLDSNPPQAILIGTRFPAFDKDLLNYATSRNFHESGLKIPDHRLFVRVR